MPHYFIIYKIEDYINTISPQGFVYGALRTFSADPNSV